MPRALAADVLEDILFAEKVLMTLSAGAVHRARASVLAPGPFIFI